MKKKITLGVIPARGGSRGIPRKNLEKIGERPLVIHTVEHASKSRMLDFFVVNSDDPEIRAVAERFGSLTMDRPDRLSHDQILQEVDLLLKWSVEKFEEENSEIEVSIVVLLYPTAPFRNVGAIDEAVRLVKEGGFDSSLSLYYDDSYLWKIEEDGVSVEPTNYDPNKRMPRQKEAWNQWVENKAVYATKREILFEEGRIGDRCGFVEMEKWRSIDIDEPEDLKLARAIYELRKGELDS